jgi:type I restriction enzyme S subunit
LSFVGKVDELMALCDRLEAARTEREATRDQFMAATFARLNAPTPDTFRNDTRFALDALPALTARADQMKQLRQTILNLAITGHLTIRWREANPAHGDADEIVRSLEAAHERNGGHRRGNASVATEGAHDFDPRQLPPSWCVTTLKSAVQPHRPITYGILMPGPDTPGGIPYIRVADFPGDKLNLNTIKRTTKEIEERYERARLAPNDVLLSIRGTVGRTCLVPPELDGANITQDTARLSLQSFLDRDFVLIVLRAPATQSRMQKCLKGVAVRGINIGDVRAIQLPIPPLAEQNRIVAKVRELMALCDRLEATLNAADETRRSLLEALLAEALEPIADRKAA